MWTSPISGMLNYSNSVGPLSIITLSAPKWRLYFGSFRYLGSPYDAFEWKDCALLGYILNKKLKPAFLGFLKWMPVLNGPVQSKRTVKELIIGLKRFYDDLWLLYTFIQPRTYKGLCRCKIFLRCVIFKMQVRISAVYKKTEKQKGCVIFQSAIFVFRKNENSDNADANYFVWFCETLQISYAVHLRSISANWRPIRKVSRNYAIFAIWNFKPCLQTNYCRYTLPLICFTMNRRQCCAKSWPGSRYIMRYLARN